MRLSIRRMFLASAALMLFLVTVFGTVLFSPRLTVVGDAFFRTYQLSNMCVLKQTIGEDTDYLLTYLLTHLRLTFKQNVLFNHNESVNFTQDSVWKLENSLKTRLTDNVSTSKKLFYVEPRVSTRTGDRSRIAGMPYAKWIMAMVSAIAREDTASSA